MDSTKIIRFFETLDVFETNADRVSCVMSWRCEKENSVSAHELKEGLLSLSQTHFQKCLHFIMALKDKKAKKREKEYIPLQEKNLERHKESSLYLNKRAIRKQNRCHGSLPIHPVPQDDSKSDNDVAKLLCNCEKRLEGSIGKNKKSSVVGIFVSILRSIISGRSQQVSPSNSKIISEEALEVLSRSDSVYSSDGTCSNSSSSSIIGEKQRCVVEEAAPSTLGEIGKSQFDSMFIFSDSPLDSSDSYDSDESSWYQNSIVDCR